MPIYNITDPASGKSVKLTGDSPPTEQELNQIFSSVGSGPSQQEAAQQKAPSGSPVLGYLKETASNIPSDAWRLTKDIGSLVAHPIDTVRGVGNIIGGAGETLSRDLFGSKADYSPKEQAFLGVMNPLTESIMNPAGIPGRVGEFVKERPVTSLLNASIGLGGAGKIAEASGMARTAGVLGKAAEVTNPVLQGARAVAGTAKAVVPPIGRIVKEAVGAYTGRGPGFVEEMVKGADAAENAMRGGLTGEEVVAHAKDGLQKLRDMRGEEYVAKLDTIKTNPEKLNGVAKGLNKTVNTLTSPDRFDVGVSMGDAGKLQVDFSKSTIVEHQAVVTRALEDVAGWTDNTVKGLDTLKKRLSTYIDQTGRNTPARAFVTQLEQNLSNGLKSAVPGYADMTKGYSEASNLIKDIESNLMLRKEGMSGRITADQTLRRLSSAFRENFDMRKDLLRALGNESGMNIPAEVAGYLAQQWMPAGLVGKGMAAGAGYLSLVNPSFWPVLAASSPRVVGEFLNAYGKAARGVKQGIGKAVDAAERVKTGILGSAEMPGGVPPGVNIPGTLSESPTIPSDIGVPAYQRGALALPTDLTAGDNFYMRDIRPGDSPAAPTQGKLVLPNPAQGTPLPAELSAIPPQSMGRLEVPQQEQIIRTVTAKPDKVSLPSKQAGPENIVTWLERQGGVNPGADYNAKEMRQFTDLARVAKNKSPMQWDEAAQLANETGFVPPGGEPFTGDSLQELIKSGQGRKIFTPEKQDAMINRQLRSQENDWIEERLAILEAEGIDTGTATKNNPDFYARALEEIDGQGSLHSQDLALKEIESFFSEVSDKILKKKSPTIGKLSAPEKKSAQGTLTPNTKPLPRRPL